MLQEYTEISLEYRNINWRRRRDKVEKWGNVETFDEIIKEAIEYESFKAENPYITMEYRNK